MRRRRAWIAAALSLVLVLVAGGCDLLATPTDPGPLRYRDAIFTGVTKTADISYGHAVDQDGVDNNLTLDMYQPAGDTARARPAIVWVHGGSFKGGSKTSGELVDEANYFAQRGYVNVSINYRLWSGGCPGTDIPKCVTAIIQAQQDAQTAVRFLRQNAAAYRIDPDRIAIGGSSAGAITALNVGFSPENPGPGDHQGFSSAVRAVQSLSGAQIASSPINPGDAPALLFHGTADPLVAYSSAQHTADVANQSGVPAVLVTWEGAGHVPYTEHRTEILTDTSNFFYWQLSLADAAR
ncbi:MAG TPA: alpha/beta hydrolase [Acidimicrobiales bacterium]|nr:alpha/beta hydrolase [Acidimicrobiales bacterium]